MLSSNAVGRITDGANPNNAMAAKYPDAPAWPTDEYNAAAEKISSVSTAMVVMVIVLSNTPGFGLANL